MSNESEKQRPSYYIGDQSNVTNSPNIQGDRNSIGNITNSDSNNTSIDLKAEIRKTLDELAKNPITRKEAVATEAIKEEIKANPILKERLLNALKAGGTEALKAIFNHPVVSISIETIKGFLEAKSDNSGV
jgi:predicted transcriptional regulator